MGKLALFLSIVTPSPLTPEHTQLPTVPEILLEGLSICARTEKRIFSVVT